MVTHRSTLLPQGTSSVRVVETEAQRRGRLERDSARIDEGLAAAKAGDIIAFDAFSTWVESLDTPDELPPPA
jgi:predicted transcriptional regulator